MNKEILTIFKPSKLNIFVFVILIFSQVIYLDAFTSTHFLPSFFTPFLDYLKKNANLTLQYSLFLSLLFPTWVASVLVVVFEYWLKIPIFNFLIIRIWFVAMVLIYDYIISCIFSLGIRKIKPFIFKKK